MVRIQLASDLSSCCAHNRNRSERESGHAEVLKVLERAVTNNLNVTPIELSNNEGGQSRVVALRQILCTRRKSNCFLAANVGREVEEQHVSVVETFVHWISMRK